MLNRQPKFSDNEEEEGSQLLGVILLGIACLGLVAILIAQVWA